MWCCTDLEGFLKYYMHLDLLPTTELKASPSCPSLSALLRRPSKLLLAHVIGAMFVGCSNHNGDPTWVLDYNQTRGEHFHLVSHTANRCCRGSAEHTNLGLLADTALHVTLARSHTDHLIPDRIVNTTKQNVSFLLAQPWTNLILCLLLNHSSPSWKFVLHVTELETGQNIEYS